MQRIAIVTGASSGVGKEFVRQFDEGKGGPLDAVWLVARNEAELAKVAGTCTHVGTSIVPCDLTAADGIDYILKTLEDADVVVEWLINSAGFGKFGDYREVGLQANADMVRLNCLAVVQMTSIVLPHMHAGSRIVNLSSIAGAIPQTMLATYSATKAFVLELSRMLDYELRSCGIHVTAVCPKFMRTKFLDEPGSADDAKGMCRIGFEDVDRVVAKALRAAVFARPVCIPSIDMRCAYAAARHMPRKLLFGLEDLLFRKHR